MPRLDMEAPRSFEKHIRVMIRGHELILAILKTPGLAESLEALKVPANRKKIAADPLQAARDAGVQLPEEGVAVYLREFTRNWEVEVQITERLILYVFGFNHLKGFYVK